MEGTPATTLDAARKRTFANSPIPANEQMDGFRPKGDIAT